MVEQAFRMANLAVIKTQGETMNDDAAWLLKQLFNVEGSAAKALVNSKPLKQLQYMSSRPLT